MDTNIRIWKGMLKEGVYPEHVVKQAEAHKIALERLASSLERDLALEETTAFIEQLKENKDDPSRKR